MISTRLRGLSFAPNLTTRLLIGSALGLMSGSAAFAQETAATAQPEAAAPDGGLEDIVVTARRVEERLQDVPLSVTALSAETVSDAQITQVIDLRSLVSNVSTSKTSTPGGTSMTIRGAASGGLPNISLDNRIGIYLDGVYIARSQGGSFPIADIERVEVLKGPQGTLFGRNTTGGNINFVTATPKGTFGGIVEGGVGNFGRQRYRVSLDFPTVANFSVRLGYVHDQNHGDIRNLTPGRTYGPLVNPAANFNYQPRPSSERFGGHNNDSFFAAVRFEGIEGLVADYKFDYSDSVEYSHGGQTLGYAGNFVGCGGAVVGQGLSYDCGLNPPVTAGTPTNVPASFDKLHELPQDFQSPANIRHYGHSLTLNYELSDAVRLRSITGIRNVSSSANFDLDGGDIYVNNAALNQAFFNATGFPGPMPATGVTPYCLSCSVSIQDQRQFSQELQVLATVEKFDLLGGLYYFSERGESQNFFVSNYNPLNGLFGFGLPPLTAGTNFVPDFNFSNGDLTIARAKSIAAFGRATWHATDKLDLVVGARYSQDTKHNTISPVLAALVDVDNDISNGFQPAPLDARVKFRKFTYEGTATYKVTEDLNVFVRYATAYLTGGLIRNIPYRPETTRSIEAGLKSEWFDRKLRFNLVGFIQKSKDLQLPINQLPFGTLVVVNLGEQTNKGFEAEIAAAPLDGLTLSANVGYTHQRASDGGRNAAPEWTIALAGAYDLPKFSNGSFLQLQLDANYASKSYFNRFPLQVVGNPGNSNDGTPLPPEVYAGYADQTAYLTALDEASTRGGYWLANARLSLVDIPVGDSRARISGYVRNIFDENHLMFGANYGTQVLGYFEQDRSYGLDLRIEF